MFRCGDLSCACQQIDRQPSRGRLLRSLRAILLVAVALGAWLLGPRAFAVEPCTTWTLAADGGAPFNTAWEGGNADVVCANAALLITTAGAYQVACQASEYMFYHVVAGSSVKSVRGTRNGCTLAESADFTQAQVLNLLSWGFLVMLSGVGYIGGRQR